MKMKKLLLFFLILLLASGTCCLTVMAVSVISEKQYANGMLAELKSDGYNQVEKVWFEKKSICCKAVSNNDGPLNYEDIMLIRAIRNKARYLAHQNSKTLSSDITSLNQIITNSEGEILYEVTVDDFYDIPQDFNESIRLREGKTALSQEDTLKALVQALNEKKLPLKVSDCCQNSLGGYLLDISFDENGGEKATIDVINETVQECLSAIDELNEKGHSITAFNLDFTPVDDTEPLYFMSADLIYRDFLWCQSPDLGNATWTGSTPQLPEE